MIFAIFVIAALTVMAIVQWRHLQRARRTEYIRSFAYPHGLYERLIKKRPSLEIRDCQLVGHALRQFFLAHLKSDHRHVSMPSQLADDLWHEFILYTKNYQHFCANAFGRFLHHSPAVVLGSSQIQDAGLQRVWWHACREENINPKAPARLPLLFALDGKFNIPDGYRYIPDCGTVRRSDANGSSTPYCGAELAAVSSKFRGSGNSDVIGGQGGDSSHAGHGGHSANGGHGGDSGAGTCSGGSCSGGSCGGGCGGGGD